MTDVFKVQDEIAAAVVEQLKIKLLGAAPKTRATDPQAYALFLQAARLAASYTARRSSNRLRCTSRRSRSIPAMRRRGMGLADAYCDQVDSRSAARRRGLSGWRAKRRARHWRSTRSTRRRTHALGWIAIYYDRDLAAAARHLEHALALEPANPDIIGDAGVSGSSPRTAGSGDRNRRIPGRPRPGERRRPRRTWLLPTATPGVWTRPSPSSHALT